MVARTFMISALFLTSFSCSKKDKPNEPEQPVEPVELAARVVNSSLVFPWDILWGPDNQVWVSERGGKISRIDPETGNVTPMLTISEVVTRGEGGLLGMAIPASFNTNPYLFIAYNYLNGGQYREKLVRYTYSGGNLGSPVIIHDNVEASNIHNGCRIVISADNKVFFSTGDASDQSLPQNFSSRNGKILRLNLDGSIPSDNPDPASPVWSIGHRNAQGLVFVKDSLWSSEHGPDSDDEINVIHRGGNYGWPDVKGECDPDEQAFCDAHHVVEPLMTWTPTIATCGLDYYTKDLLPQWKNSLLLCTLKGSKLIQLKLNDAGSDSQSATDFFAGDYGRLRDVCISPGGKVYLCTSNGTNDKLVEISAKE